MGQPNRIISAPKLGIPNTSQHVFAAPSDPWTASRGGRAMVYEFEEKPRWGNEELNQELFMERLSWSIPSGYVKIAMENGPFTDDFPHKTSIYNGFSIAMLNYQRVLKRSADGYSKNTGFHGQKKTAPLEKFCPQEPFQESWADKKRV